MFREGRHVPKSNLCTENMHHFFHRFFVVFSPKTMKNRAKNVQNGFLHKNRQKIRLQRAFLAKSRCLFHFWSPYGSPGASRGVPGASQNASFFSKSFSCVSKRARTVPGRPQGCLGVPQAPPGYHFGSIFRPILHGQKHRQKIKNVKETSQKLLTELERNEL